MLPTARTLAALALLLVLLTGCHRPTGTAWTPGVDGPAGGPATFSAAPPPPAAPPTAPAVPPLPGTPTPVASDTLGAAPPSTPTP